MVHWRALLRFAPILLFIPVLVYRVYLCAQPPEDTSDLYRHLGYASHLFERGLQIYKTTPQDFAPEFWTQFWPYTPYIYPPGAMLFFSLFGTAGIGLFWVKLIFTVFDLFSSIIVARVTNPLCGLLLFSAPVALWYTSHEGMYESLVLFPMLVSAYTAIRGRWFLSGVFWMLALQLKQFPLLMAPLFLSELLRAAPSSRRIFVQRFFSGFVLAFIPFLPFYFAAPNIWLRPVQLHLTFNPFSWDFTNRSLFGWIPSWLIAWNAVTSGLIFIFAVALIFRRPRFLSFLEAMPITSFWALLKSLNWGQFWYAIPAAGFFIGLHRSKRLVLLFLILHWLQCGRSLALLSGPPFGIREYQATIDRFQSCLWTCDYKFAPEAVNTPENMPGEIHR